VRNASSTLDALFALVSMNGIPRSSAYFWVRRGKDKFLVKQERNKKNISVGGKETACNTRGRFPLLLLPLIVLWCVSHGKPLLKQPQLSLPMINPGGYTIHEAKLRLFPLKANNNSNNRMGNICQKGMAI